MIPTLLAYILVMFVSFKVEFNCRRHSLREFEVNKVATFNSSRGTLEHVDTVLMGPSLFELNEYMRSMIFNEDGSEMLMGLTPNYVISMPNPFILHNCYSRSEVDLLVLKGQSPFLRALSPLESLSISGSYKGAYNGTFYSSFQQTDILRYPQGIAANDTPVILRIEETYRCTQRVLFTLRVNSLIHDAFLGNYDCQEVLLITCGLSEDLSVVVEAYWKCSPKVRTFYIVSPGLTSVVDMHQLENGDVLLLSYADTSFMRVLYISRESILQALLNEGRITPHILLEFKETKEFFSLGGIAVHEDLECREGSEGFRRFVYVVGHSFWKPHNGWMIKFRWTQVDNKVNNRSTNTTEILIPLESSGTQHSGNVSLMAVLIILLNFGAFR